jgi:tetratricopeptide (TPR) repeat protein
MRKNITMACVFVMILSLLACKDYLDAKPDKDLETISTLNNLQSLLDDNVRLNTSTPYAAEVASDDYYLKDANLTAISIEGDRRIYNWQKGNQFEGTDTHWTNAYTRVYYGNTVLENIKNIDRTEANAKDWDDIKGQGYFVKGNGLLLAVTIWAPAYDDASSSTDLGVPIRISTDFNIKTSRSTVAQNYAQIIDDLKHAAQLLPSLQIHPMRASRTAAYAILSRTYMAMNKYAEAGLYADSALMLNNVLMDYNDLNSLAVNPMTPYKGEVLFHQSIANPVILNQSNAIIVDELYQQYQPDDLRKKLYFKSVGTNQFAFRASYSGGNAGFFGPAVDEMYLNRAESYARTNKLTEALADLNFLMQKRWDKSKIYPKFISTDKTTVINWILTERRKELLMRGLRWIDLKRLNKLGYNIELKRKYNSFQSTLPPNDPRYAMSIPELIIEMTGIPQNP